MAFAATIAGIGFGSVGVHVPHALAYPIASLKHAWDPGYPGAAPFVPHGFAVAVTAPAVFSFVEEVASDRCREAAQLLDGGNDLAGSFERLMKDVSAPSSLSELGYAAEDVPQIVEGALKQQRLLVCSPRDVGEVELTSIVHASL
jgi:alcohol dehydrogenase class IV